MENEDVILFRFMTNVYNDKQKTYNAPLPEGGRSRQDFSLPPLRKKRRIKGSLPYSLYLSPLRANFAAILPSEEVVSLVRG